MPTKLTPWSRVLEKLTVTQLINKNSPSFMKPKVRYRVHNSPTLTQILSQIHHIHTFPPYSSKIYSNIILPSTPSSSKWSLPFRFSNKNIVRISHLPMRASHPAHLILDLITLIIFGEAYKL